MQTSLLSDADKPEFLRTCVIAQGKIRALNIPPFCLFWKAEIVDWASLQKYTQPQEENFPGIDRTYGHWHTSVLKIVLAEISSAVTILPVRSKTVSKLEGAVGCSHLLQRALSGWRWCFPHEKQTA